MRKFCIPSSCIKCVSAQLLKDLELQPPVAANDNDPFGRRVIHIPKDDELSRPSVVNRLAIALKAKGLSRRRIPDWMATTFAQFDGVLVDPNGHFHCVCKDDVDKTFGDEASWRYMGYVLGFAISPPKQRMQARVVPRLRLIAIALLIENPLLMTKVMR